MTTHGPQISRLAALAILAAMLVVPSAQASATQHARLHAPEDVAFDRAGRLLVSEFSGNRVDRIVTGRARAIAGTGVAGYSGDGGPAVDAKLDEPTGLFVEHSGDLLIADHRNGCIRDVGHTTHAIVRIVGRCSHEGYSGDGGPAIHAKLNDPIGIVEDMSGNLYIADEQNARVREVSSRGIITTIAGGGDRRVANAPDGTPATELRLSHPSYLALDRRGDLYLSDFLANVVIAVHPSGRITHVAGTGRAGFSGDGGPATRARLDFPTGLALDQRGRLLISDTFNNRIRRVDGDGVITTIAGTGKPGYAGDGGPAVNAQLNATAGLALDARGRVVIADQGNNAIRRIANDGIISTVAGRAHDGSARPHAASAEPTPIPVRTTRADEITPAAAGSVLTWSRNSAAHPGRYNEFAHTAAGTVRVNASGQARGGGVFGSTLVYQNGSRLRLYDVTTRETTSSLPGWANGSESAPTISGDHVLFGRSAGAGASVRLGSLSTGSQMILGSSFKQPPPIPGQVNGSFAVWIACQTPRTCSLIRLDMTTHTRTGLPNRIIGYPPPAPSVTGTGTVYYVTRGVGCGSRATLIRQPVRGRAVVVHRFDPGVAVNSTYVDDTSGTPTVYYSRGVCVDGRVPNADIYKIVD